MRRLVLSGACVAVVLGLIYAGYRWYESRSWVTTDDAYVEGSHHRHQRQGARSRRRVVRPGQPGGEEGRSPAAHRPEGLSGATGPGGLSRGHGRGQPPRRPLRSTDGAGRHERPDRPVAGGAGDGGGDRALGRGRGRGSPGATGGATGGHRRHACRGGGCGERVTAGRARARADGSPREGRLRGPAGLRHRGFGDGDGGGNARCDPAPGAPGRARGPAGRGRAAVAD